MPDRPESGHIHTQESINATRVTEGDGHLVLLETILGNMPEQRRLEWMRQRCPRLYAHLALSRRYQGVE